MQTKLTFPLFVCISVAVIKQRSKPIWKRKHLFKLIGSCLSWREFKASIQAGT